MTPTDMSEEDAAQLLDNRVKFKIYAAEQNLKNLRILESQGSTMQSSKERVLWEIDIECFLFHIVGVLDALLHKINDKLALNVREKKVKPENISKKLTELNERRLLTDLENLYCDNVFCILRHLRNQSTHKKLINVHFRVEVGDPKEKASVSFIVDPKMKLKLTPFLSDFHNIHDPSERLEIIPFLEEGLTTVKSLVQRIMDDESRLR